MGTHPDTGSHPAMPDPARVVSRSVSTATRNGIERDKALAIIQVIAAMLYDLADAHCPELCPWASGIQLEASRRMRPRQPPDTDNTGEDYGDGPGRPASGATQDQH